MAEENDQYVILQDVDGNDIAFEQVAELELDGVTYWALVEAGAEEEGVLMVRIDEAAEPQIDDIPTYDLTIVDDEETIDALWDLIPEDEECTCGDEDCAC